MLGLVLGAGEQRRTSDGRRYTFANQIPVGDLGLSLADVDGMDLDSEPVDAKGDWQRRVITLKEYGATADEIAFYEAVGSS